MLSETEALPETEETTLVPAAIAGEPESEPMTPAMFADEASNADGDEETAEDDEDENEDEEDDDDVDDEDEDDDEEDDDEEDDEDEDDGKEGDDEDAPATDTAE